MRSAGCRPINGVRPPVQWDSDQWNCDLCLMDYPLSTADPRLNGLEKLKQLHKHPAASEEQFSHCPRKLEGGNFPMEIFKFDLRQMERYSIDLVI